VRLQNRERKLQNAEVFCRARDIIRHSTADFGSTSGKTRSSAECINYAPGQLVLTSIRTRSCL
jgi:hypothetical protein